MNRHASHIGRLRLAAIGFVTVALATLAYAQTPPPAPATGTAAAPPPAAAKTFSQEQLEQLAAPVALYPDPLLAQIFMASTYPLDIVMADRWVKANPKVKDKALEDALQKQPWDPSVKSLTAVPQVLSMMSEKLDLTQQMGDAFLAQPKELMDAVQKLRQKASAQGNLKDTKEQKVVTEQVATQTVIKIEPADPQVVYVPTYNPAVVYGAWAYPAYPPYAYYPPAYYGAYAGAGLVGFTAGVVVGAALWGNCNWGGGDVNVNVNKYNNFNRTNIQNTNFQHNADRRGGVPYKDQGVAQKFDRGQSANAGTRDQYRGRDGQQSDRAGDRTGDRAGDRTGDRAGDRTGDRAGDRAAGAGGRDLAGGAGGRDLAGGASAGTRDVGGGGRDISSGRASAGTMDRGGGGGNYGGGGGRSASSGSAFGGGSGASARNSSNRGSSSMASSRGGGGGARAGGGGRGGGGRR